MPIYFFPVQSANGRGKTQLTPTEVTAQLDAFTETLPGLVPAPGSVVGNVLSDDGTWIAPGGGAGVTDGDKGDIVVSGTGTVWTLDATAVASLNLATTGAKGLAPVLSNVATEYLNGTGAWSTPAGGSYVSPLWSQLA